MDPTTTVASVAAIIAAKDEAARIVSTIAAVRRIDGVDLVIVVDDGSSDATARLAGEAGAVVVGHPRNRGKAAAMATGAQVAADYDVSDVAERTEPVDPVDLATSERAGCCCSSTATWPVAPPTWPC